VKRAGASALLLVFALDSEAASAEPLSSAPVAGDASGSQKGNSPAALIVLVEDEPGDAVSAWLERDLRSLGLAVIVLSATPENSSGAEALERTARSLGGMAAIRVLANARGSELWLSDPATNHTLSRSVAPASASGDASEVALGTLELLRASMLELRAQSRAVGTPPGPEPAAAPSIDPEPKTARFSLSGGLAADLGLRSVGPSLSTIWGAGLALAGCFELRAYAALPLLAQRRDVPEGRVEVEPLLLGGGLGCSFVRNDARLWPRVSLGVAGARVTTRGTAIDPLLSSSDNVWLAGGYGVLGLGLRIARDVRVNLDATGVLLPTPAVILVGRQQVATWGAPGGLLSLGVEVLAGP
jgi:hypothetical protein